MNNYVISFDFLDTKPISLNNILQIAFDVNTEDEYADYLYCVLNIAKARVESIGKKIEVIQFRIHENGGVLPFGEMLQHPYALKKFYKPFNEIRHELPILPPNIL